MLAARARKTNCLTRVGRPRTTPVSARRLVGTHLVIPDDIACLLGPAEGGMAPREARRAGGVGPKPAPVVSAPPRGGPNRLGRSPSAAVVAQDRRDTRRAVAPAQNAHGHRRDETPPAARPGGLGDFGLPRGTRRAGRDGVDDERSPLLRWLENHLRGVARGQRVPSHPLYLPVPVATRSYERRVFACASPSSMRTSKSLGSLHSSAFRRRCRAMSTAQMIILARARASDVAYPNTCSPARESNSWRRLSRGVRTLGLGQLVCREQTIKKI